MPLRAWPSDEDRRPHRASGGPGKRIQSRAKRDRVERRDDGQRDEQAERGACVDSRVLSPRSASRSIRRLRSRKSENTTIPARRPQRECDAHRRRSSTQPRDEARRVGSEEERPGRPSRRVGRARFMSDAPAMSCCISAVVADHVGVDRTGRERVHADPARRELRRHRARGSAAGRPCPRRASTARALKRKRGRRDHVHDRRARALLEGTAAPPAPGRPVPRRFTAKRLLPGLGRNWPSACGRALAALLTTTSIRPTAPRSCARRAAQRARARRGASARRAPHRRAAMRCFSVFRARPGLRGSRRTTSAPAAT